MATGILSKKLPPNMKSSFWIDFIDAIEEESELVKSQILEKKYYFDIDNMPYDRMVDVASTLGLPFNVSVISTEDFLREELRSIPFRLKWKATAKLYQSFLKNLKREGNLYVYYYDTFNLLKYTVPLLTNILTINPLEPYFLLSRNNFTGVLATKIKLDEGYKLDEGWNLDSGSSQIATKHLALEFFIDRTFTWDSSGLAPSETLEPSLDLSPSEPDIHLMHPYYLSYLEDNIEVSKKATEVFHIGCQLAINADNSRIKDSMGEMFTMPNLYLNSVTTDNIAAIASVVDITHCIFGTGTNEDLPSSTEAYPQPTQLENKIAKVEILSAEKFEDDNWYGICATYKGKLINDVVIGTGDGIESEFTYTLSDIPIKPGNIEVTLTSGGSEYTLQDDITGNLYGDFATGTINYTTGEISIDTDIDIRRTQIVGTGNGTTTGFSFNLDNRYIPITPSSISILYNIGNTSYIATDNGSGILSGTSCTGTIDYSTGVGSLTFSLAPLDDSDISCVYEYHISKIPDGGTDIYVKYYSDTELPITEVGLVDASDNLLAYATFPKIILNSFKNHLSVTFMIKKSDF